MPAYLTRTGVFTYTRGDGTKIRELRLPEEVFDSESLNTLAGVPVTDMHPSEMVSSVNWKKYSVGHVGESIRRDGRFVAADLTLQDDAIVKAVEAGQRKEISCGYSCRLDYTRGVHEGETYDAIQRDIRYNHAALGPEQWGRAGRDVRLRLDAADAVMDAEQQVPDGSGTRIDEDTERTMKIRLDGIEYDSNSDAFAQAFEKFKNRMDAELAALKAEQEKLQGRSDAAERELTEAKKKVTELEDPKRIDSLVTARVDLVTKAQKVLGAEVKLDGKTDREIMLAALEAKYKGEKFDGSDDYVRGAFEHMVRVSADDRSSSRNDALDQTRKVVDAANKGKGEDRFDTAAARARMEERNAKAWQKPLAMSKQTHQASS